MKTTRTKEKPVERHQEAQERHQVKDPYETRTFTPATPRCNVTINHHPESRREG